MDLFFEIHKDLPREGPGDSTSTRKAFALIKNLPTTPRILDIACGPGMQTIDFAQLSSGKVIALDNHAPFLKTLQSQTQNHGLAERIALINASMFDLPFTQNSFDIIWSEGAIYIIGFENGLKNWKKLLKSGGFLAVTELSWLKNNPPREAYSYWTKEYPGIHGIGENLQIICAAGYSLVGYFVLPVSSWWINYYTPIEKRLSVLHAQYEGEIEAHKILDDARDEIEMFRKFSEWYGYVFYVMQSP